MVLFIVFDLVRPKIVHYFDIQLILNQIKEDILKRMDPEINSG